MGVLYREEFVPEEMVCEGDMISSACEPLLWISWGRRGEYGGGGANSFQMLDHSWFQEEIEIRCVKLMGLVHLANEPKCLSSREKIVARFEREMHIRSPSAAPPPPTTGLTAEAIKPRGGT